MIKRKDIEIAKYPLVILLTGDGYRLKIVQIYFLKIILYLWSGKNGKYLAFKKMENNQHY